MSEQKPKRRKLWIGLAVVGLIIVLVQCRGDYAHVVVIDQHGDPVEGVLVRSNVQPGNAFFSRSETTEAYTDGQGRVELPVGKWFRLTRVEKEGYQFRPNAQFDREYGNDMFGGYASRFTSDDPLVLRAWKRGEQPELTYVGGNTFFPDNIDHCTLTLVEPSPENDLDEPLVWKFDLESDYQPVEEYATPTRQFKARKWRGWTKIEGAKVQDTDDLFMNRAPQDGYQEKLEWGPFVYGEEPAGIEHEEQQIFIKGANGEFYGGGVFIFRPDRGTKANLSDINREGVYFQFWFNFNGSTNIMRERSEITWYKLGRQMDKRFYCREVAED